MFRQGDVLIVPISADAVPAEARDGETATGTADRPLILALGEATGHAHAVRPDEGLCVLFQGPDENAPRYLHLPSGAKVVHEEHATIPLAAGWYRVVLQREYEPTAPRSWRTVAD